MAITIRAAIAGAAVFLSCLTAAADDGLPQALPPAQESLAIAAAETIGREIFQHDRAAAVATDAALAHRTFKRDRRVRGWLTEAGEDGIAVTFIDQTPSAIYRVMVSPAGQAGPLLALEVPEPLTHYEAGAAGARTAALEAPFQACSKTYNTVVLPSKAGTDSWVVYLLPGTTRQDTVPLGGTYRMEVRDGAVTSQRSFTRSCIALNRGPSVGAMMVTHLLDPVPTEAHVHWSLWADTPMYVSTPGGGLWAITHGAIRKVDKDGL